MRVLVIENYDNTALGQVGAALAEANAEIDLRRAIMAIRCPTEPTVTTRWSCSAAARMRWPTSEYPYFPS